MGTCARRSCLRRTVVPSASTPCTWDTFFAKTSVQQHSGTLGHEVRLMPAQYVKAYVKRNKKPAAGKGEKARNRGRDGVEIKVTRASRDRGVDAIMFDPDPLRGGKFVLQAKRYTRPVDVAAVRDLYGTVVESEEGCDGRKLR